jgi:membrane protein implicated in regulation of membrane protease activity
MLNVIFLIAAVVGGTVMVCQFVLTLLGMEGDGGHAAHDAGAGFDGAADGGDFSGDMHGGDFHGDAGADGFDGDLPSDHHTTMSTAGGGEFHHTDSSWLFGVISFRTLIAAAAFFGVAGKAATSARMSNGSALVIALVAGVAAMYGMYWIMRLIAGLTSSGNQRITSALGRRATVYIPIPADRKGAGKVQLSMQNRIVELQAVTDEPQRLKTGETVEVVAVAGSDLVRVRRVVETVGA